MDEEPESRRKPFETQCFKDRQAACSKILVFIRAKKQHRTIKRSSRKRIPVSFALLHADLFRHSHHLKRQSSWKTRVLERVALEVLQSAARRGQFNTSDDPEDLSRNGGL